MTKLLSLVIVMIMAAFQAMAQESKTNTSSQSIKLEITQLRTHNTGVHRAPKHISLEGYSNCSAGNDQSTPQTRADEKKKDDKTLSKSDYIITVASADAIGGLLSGPGAVLASGAAALYFDVE